MSAWQRGNPSSSSLQLRARAEIERRRRAAGEGMPAPSPAAARAVPSFREFVERHNPTLLRFEHVPRLIRVGQALVDTYGDPETGGLRPGWEHWEPEPGEPNWRRVILVMPRRYFKSEVVCRLLAPYFLVRFPGLWVGLTSYGAHLAQRLSRRARDRYRDAGGKLRSDSASVALWETPSGGGLFAAGMGGPLLGSGYHLGLSDDPLKPQDATSLAKQEEFEEWWPETFVSAEEPGAARWLVMQRLGATDPVDFLFRREIGEGTEAAPEGWHVVVCDEIKSPEPLWRGTGPLGLPPTCTVEHDSRKTGELLAPTRFSEAAVRRKHANLGSAVAATMMQQRPGAPKGDFWQESWFQPYGTDTGDPLLELPTDAEAGGADWDTAYTKDESNCASAFVRTYRVADPEDEWKRPRVYVAGLGFEWYEFPELVAWMRRTRGPHYIEAKATGKSAAQTLERDGVVVAEVQVDGGDKLARANGVQGFVEAGRVFVHRSLTRKLLHSSRQGLLRVTRQALQSGKGDLDLNDAFVQSLHRHAGEPMLMAVGPVAIGHTTNWSPT